MWIYTSNSQHRYTKFKKKNLLKSDAVKTEGPGACAMSRQEKGKEDLTAARPVFRFLGTPAIVFDVDALRKSVKRNDSLEVVVKPG